MTHRPDFLSERPAVDGARPEGVDPLSDVLRAVRLTGAVFFVIDAATPWQAHVGDGAMLAPVVFPAVQHVISYHIVTRGSCWGALQDGGRPVRLVAGDVLVLPRGDPYFIATEAQPRGTPTPEEDLDFLRDMAAGRLPFRVRDGAGRERLHLVCGFLGCDLRPFNPLLATLPSLLRVRHVYGTPRDPLTALIDFILAESRAPRPGGDSVRVRLSELVFVEVVRRHLAALPRKDTGWLAGLRDPVVGRALGLLHAHPARAWSLATLAREAGASRSAFADRFTHLVGVPPMHYLTLWRIQSAARLLADGDAKVLSVARSVGYDSEAAFSRAFKKFAGVPPAAWRSSKAISRGRVPQQAAL